MMQPTITQPSPRSLIVTWEDPVPVLQQLARLPGIEGVRAIASGAVPRPPLGELLDLSIPLAEAGRVTFALTPGEVHYNPMGTVHGGIIATLLDSAMGMSVQSTLDAGVRYTTLEFKVNFIRRVTVDAGQVFAEGRVVHRGRTQAVAEARLIDAAERVYAISSSTLAILAECQA